MYVRFERPTALPGDASKVKTTTLPGFGVLVGRAIVGPVSPALGSCEMRNFGVWRDANDDLKVSVPSANGNFSILYPMSDAKHQSSGEAEVAWLLGTIRTLWIANRTQSKDFFGTRFDIAAETSPANAAGNKPLAAAASTK